MSDRSPRYAPWEDFALRVIAIYKLAHAVFFTAVGFGLLKLRHYKGGLSDFLNRIIDFLNSHHIYHINPESHFVDWLLTYAQKFAPWMSFAGYAAFLYASLFAAEGIGLYLRKHWAEWLVVAATGLFIPFEIWALVRHVMWWKFVLLFGNLSIVAYLAHRILLEARMRREEPKPGTAGDARNASDEYKDKPPPSDQRVGSTGATR